MTIAHPSSHSSDAGFTLIELLVAITVLAFLSVLLLSGLRFGSRAWERSEAHSTGMDDVRAAQNLLAREIGSAFPLYLGDDPRDARVDFAGDAGGMTFLASAPDVMSQPGRARMTLESARDGGSTALMVGAVPELSQSSAGAFREPLLRHLAWVRFSYFGAPQPGMAAAWHDQWEHAQRLPTLVRVEAAFPRGDARVWPDRNAY